MNPPEISVIIPVYNAGLYLRQCLDSLLNQTAGLEIICVDDGSTDNSPEILNEYAGRDIRIRVLSQANAGAGTARNAGIDAAGGDYLFFCDADDFCEPDMLRKMRLAAEETAADITVCRYDCYNNYSGKFVKRFNFTDTAAPENGQPHPALFYMYRHVPWNKLYRREFAAANRLRFQPLKRFNDVCFVNTALAAAGKITEVDEILYHHRIKHGNNLQSGTHETPLLFTECWSGIKNELERLGLWEKHRQCFANAVLRACLFRLYMARTEEAAREIFHALKEHVFEEFGINKLPRKNFDNLSDYDSYRLLLKCGGPAEFCFRQIPAFRDWRRVRGLMRVLRGGKKKKRKAENAGKNKKTPVWTLFRTVCPTDDPESGLASLRGLCAGVTGNTPRPAVSAGILLHYTVQILFRLDDAEKIRRLYGEVRELARQISGAAGLPPEEFSEKKQYSAWTALIGNSAPRELWTALLQDGMIPVSQIKDFPLLSPVESAFYLRLAKRRANREKSLKQALRKCVKKAGGIPSGIGRKLHIALYALRGMWKRAQAGKKPENAGIPAVSVIMPVYNVAAYLPACLDSITGQTLSNIEIICVDDGSNDNSPEILARYAEKDRRITVITQTNQGAGAARNTGLKKARGVYLHFCDPDDFCDPDMLRAMYRRAADADADIAVCNADFFNEKTGEYSPDIVMPQYLRQFRYFASPDIEKDLFGSFQSPPWNKLFRREFVLRNNFRFQLIPRANDIYFSAVCLAAAERITAVHKNLYHHRKGHGENLQSRNDETPLMFLSAWRETRAELLRRGLLESCRTAFLRSVLHSCVYVLLSLRTAAAITELYNELRTRVFPEFGISGAPDGTFNKKHERTAMRNIINCGTPAEFCLKMLDFGRSAGRLTNMVTALFPENERELLLDEISRKCGGKSRNGTGAAS